MKPPRKKNPNWFQQVQGQALEAASSFPLSVLATPALALLAALNMGRKNESCPPVPPARGSPCLQPSRPGYYFHSKQHNKQQQEDFIPSVCGLFPLEILILMSSPIDFHPFKRQIRVQAGKKRVTTLPSHCYFLPVKAMHLHTLHPRTQCRAHADTLTLQAHLTACHFYESDIELLIFPFAF